MPTIKQLPVATSVSVSDVLPLSQGGTTRGVAVGNLLSSTQPALSLVSGALLGRVSATAGGPEPVAVGSGLAIAAGALGATGADHTQLPVSPSLSPGDEVVVNSGGAAKRMQATALRSLFAAGSGVSIDGSGTISASAAAAGIVSGTAASGHLVLTRGDGVAIDVGPVLAVAEPLTPTVVADGATGTDNWAVIQAALSTGRDVLLPRGEIRISKTLTMTSSAQRLMGYGPATRLRPDFAAGDVIQVGAAGPLTLNVRLENFTIWPSVAKTSGAGVKGINLGHLRVSGVWLGTYEDASGGLLLYQGFELNGCGECVIGGGGALGCLETGILIYSAAPMAEVIVEPSVQLAYNGCAVHVGGGMGGIYVSGDIQQNGQGVVVSTAFSPLGNREIFLNSAIIDSNVHEGFLAHASSITASLVVNGGWCGGTASPSAVGFSVLAGNAVTIVNGMRCDKNAGVGALFAGGPTVLSNFHADQNGSDGIQVAATCGGIYSTGAKLTGSVTGVGWRFPTTYNYEVSIVGGTVGANAGGTIVNPPSGAGQFIVGVVAYSSLFTLTRPTSGLLPADGAGGAFGWNFSSGGAEVTAWNTFTAFVPTVSHEWRQKVAGGGNTLLMQVELTGGVPGLLVGQGSVWHSKNLLFSADFTYDPTGHVLSLSAPVVAGSVVPRMDGVGAAGVSAAYARQDHVHPVDSSRLGAAANLADIASAAAARANLGLSAVAASGAYADLVGKPSVPPAYVLAPATASTLGGVKVGAGLTIGGDGTLAASGGGTTPVTMVASSGAAQGLVAAAAGDVAYDITLTANCALSLSGGVAGQLQRITVILRQDAMAGRVVTLPAGVRWPGSTAPVPNMAAGGIDVFVFSTPDAGVTWFGSY